MTPFENMFWRFASCVWVRDSGDNRAADEVSSSGRRLLSNNGIPGLTDETVEAGGPVCFSTTELTAGRASLILPEGKSYGREWR
jgi:hypothetical protein